MVPIFAKCNKDSAKYNFKKVIFQQKKKTLHLKGFLLLCSIFSFGIGQGCAGMGEVIVAAVDVAEALIMFLAAFKILDKVIADAET